MTDQHDIWIAKTDAEIGRCYPVMRELRPHIPESEWLKRVHRQQEQGYELVGLEHEGTVVACAGYRLLHNLAWGRFLYVDDLVTLEAARSHGYGAKLLRWLHDRARHLECDELHLDSGTWRKQAHRFYEREGMDLTSYHFATKFDSPGP